jgi:hypothetical protein
VIPAWLQDEFKDTLLYCFCCEARDTIQFIRMWQSTGDDALAFLRMAVVRAFIKTDPKLRPIPIAISCASVEDEMPRRATRSHCYLIGIGLCYCGHKYSESWSSIGAA